MSLFGSLRDKLSNRNRSRSPSLNPDVLSHSGDAHLAGPSGNKTVSGADNAPPPPYTPIDPAPAFPTLAVSNPPSARQPSPAPSFSSARSNPSITSREDPYAFLSSFDTIFLIDDSGSMAGRSWREVKEVLVSIAPVCTSHDANGIDVYFLNARNPSPSDRDDRTQGFRNITTPKQVEDVFRRVRPQGATPTGTHINAILRPYLRELEHAIARTGNPDECGVKPINMIVITDGAPTDDPEAVIVSLAKKLDALDAPPHQVGIQFFQVGNDPEATRALKELDDGLTEQGGGIRDMVDTVTWESSPGKPLSADAILKVVLGAVVKRLDRRTLDGQGRRGDHLAP
ncbi:hypothetical protein MYCTH_2311429 [Thermothelomyces thermophilus ATCC 42464]|uniref:VWFA domain-containing protein n=1 Tax=Thermothelomyces thermophilus (strain ATCC 42464 / BCRC 31852 / DSM 1799) TaxID=573729 RepID=G2QP52_THET4|nr:uncharacterized protein MYCTH_2311429 [Thermothelomyces thermophilus ATCC 42464]AEO61365.1 hypothetical protein MYCTH_2311429 [Thermothelomyces thermophilus ATCC 42464]